MQNVLQTFVFEEIARGAVIFFGWEKEKEFSNYFKQKLVWTGLGVVDISLKTNTLFLRNFIHWRENLGTNCENLCT